MADYQKVMSLSYRAAERTQRDQTEADTKAGEADLLPTQAMGTASGGSREMGGQPDRPGTHTCPGGSVKARVKLCTCSLQAPPHRHHGCSGEWSEEIVTGGC